VKYYDRDSDIAYFEMSDARVDHSSEHEWAPRRGCCRIRSAAERDEVAPAVGVEAQHEEVDGGRLVETVGSPSWP
jgi:uncharacterized protein YuzE